MSDNYIIEIRPRSAGITVQAGIVIRDGHGFRFFAASHAFDSLDGQFFKNPKAAEQAAIRRVASMTSITFLSPPRDGEGTGSNAASR
jgi:hypothetical protein